MLCKVAQVAMILTMQVPVVSFLDSNYSILVLDITGKLHVSHYFKRNARDNLSFSENIMHEPNLKIVLYKRMKCSKKLVTQL